MQEPLPPQFYVELQLAPIEKGEIRLTKRQYVNESCVAEGWKIILEKRKGESFNNTCAVELYQSTTIPAPPFPGYRLFFFLMGFLNLFSFGIIFYYPRISFLLSSTFTG